MTNPKRVRRSLLEAPKAEKTDKATYVTLKRGTRKKSRPERTQVHFEQKVFAILEVHRSDT